MHRSKINKKNLTEVIQKNIAIALQEDIGNIDLSSELIEEKSSAKAYVKSKDSAVISGIPWFNTTFLMLDPKIKIKWFIKEGAIVKKNQRLCEIYGKTKPILSGERVALNFLQTLSATSTITHQYVQAIKNTHAKIFDTRKTIPGLRIAQKYAVTIGGGNNQRMGLFDQILIKENHIKSSKKMDDLLSLSLKYAKNKDIQIEVENLNQFEKAIEIGFKNILLDNFSIKNLKKAVLLNKKRAVLEASGNITLKNVKKIALTGVNRISLGSLTKNIKAIDLSMKIETFKSL
ncbi:carboxylating nicotinate-nucleotide diphosphorylase [Candidatus Methylopumilus rimovensis]|jgi:nicotinate-nucleotide pyrophosphorylase (carboxylating)|uniref:Probable nicotinate-nucleotide pyrophosphorylase [carboxylating] n=1 Tax=Candidatus Methylopumilus rimovensis TaxID=2588535 RepID=A0AAE6KPK2_9PROT|nr:carboxylating nicotinate-nucleotide diphosphorylase [Candidatus Methylopumilus rimovensis]QDD12467.1 carboxylating nicotinate-nucleotide diphosphorylase [Candidatus Methylopumilus rimovensis]QDD13772.1 carboxylating nicotinate-nucleotide diphosphorylase [Candidatus Methylopumilus rimovensis]